LDTINSQELKAKLDAGDDFTLMMTMLERHYLAAHIPGSVFHSSLELDTIDLPIDRQIVVYCSSEGCVASKNAYDSLVARGYTNVRHFKGGLAAWAGAGNPLEGE
jgi:rhodanese-related sulfurtransferase